MWTEVEISDVSCKNNKPVNTMEYQTNSGISQHWHALLLVYYLSEPEYLEWTLGLFCR